MEAFLWRIISCAAGAATSLLILGMPAKVEWLFLISLYIFILYLVVRPLMLLIALPFNVFLFGVFTLFIDALLVWWAQAWTAGIEMGYLQSMLTATFIWVYYLPYSMRRRRIRM